MQIQESCEWVFFYEKIIVNIFTMQFELYHFLGVFNWNSIIITIKEIEALCAGNFYYSCQVEAVGPAYYTGSFQIGPSSPAPLPYILQQAKTKGQSQKTNI